MGIVSSLQFAECCSTGGEETPKKIKSKHLIDTNAIKQRNYISQIQNIEGTYKRKKKYHISFYCDI